MADFLSRADDLVVSTVCAHLNLRSLRAVAQAVRSFRKLATWELQLRVVKRVGDKRYSASFRMLLILRIFDDGARARLTAPLLEVLLQRQKSVRRPPSARAHSQCDGTC
jgi:hypothetical protein